ncbi:enoyl-CoA hydratase/isomerase family protein [Pseudogracilibacillus sp. SO30301A]|uniref:enoyl-CoA hydratase/isomerase family protein n=1 Tax=Pseudogracilibacillus sp. SO30301A TaxID=3098291 RepID=UPI00300DFC8F
MNKQNIITSLEENVLTITINRSDSYNSLSTQTKIDLADAFMKADTNPDVKAIIITGAGDKSFCSGQDLAESKDLDEGAAENWIDEFDHLYRVIRKVKKPIIAAINGFSVGSGLQLALLADIRISNKSAKYGMTEVNVGLPCVIGATMFWETMGRSKTIDLILTGRLISAEEAKEYNLITRIVNDDELHEKAFELAKELASKPPTAIAINKRRFNQLSEIEFNNCMNYAVEAHTIGYGSGEPQQAMKEFFEKRAKAK